MPQAAKVGTRRLRVLENLAAKAGRGGEYRGIVLRDDPGPQRGVLRARIDDGGCPIGPRVREAGSQRVGPVEGAGVQHAIVGADPVPALVHGPPAKGGALGMQNAFGACCRSRSIDEKGRIVGGRVRPRCARTSRDHAGNLVVRKRAHATGQSFEAETLSNSNCLHIGGVQQKAHLGFGKLGGCRHRYESACNRAEEDKRVGARIL